jgi:hypothetical protein
MWWQAGAQPPQFLNECGGSRPIASALLTDSSVYRNVYRYPDGTLFQTYALRQKRVDELLDH